MLLHLHLAASLSLLLSPLGEISGASSTDSLRGSSSEELTALDPTRATWLRAPHVALGDGRVLEDAWVVIEGGVIKAVGPDLEPRGQVTRFDLEGYLSPGLIALGSHEGTAGERLDATRPVMADADLSKAFRPEAPDFSRTLAAGITSVVLVPANEILVPGTTAVVKTSGGGVVRPAAQLVLTFSRGALSNDVYPTSYPGALGELEARFLTPRGSFSRAAAGTLPVLMRAELRHEVQNALSFAQRFGLRGALYGARWTGDLVEPIRDSGLAVVMEPLQAGGDARTFESLVALSAAGTRVGFALEAPGNHPHSLRFGAAAAVRAGLDPDKALVALTGDAALIADVAGRVGRIEPGRDADLVLWSGPPLDLRSTVRAVWIDGRRVYGGEQ